MHRWHVLSLLLLSALFSLSASRITAQLGATSDALPIAAVKPTPEFARFKSDLESSIKSRSGGLDPQTHTFNFVVLFNTAATTGPAPKLMRDLYFDLAHHYLIKGETTGDQIAFVPFQLEVRKGECKPLQPFSVQALSDQAPSKLDNTPDRPKDEPGFIGGNDFENALKWAIDNIAKANQAASTIYITLSNNSASQAPLKEEAGYHHRFMNADEFARLLNSNNLIEAPVDKFPPVGEKTEKNYVAIHIYAPRNLTARGALTSSSRAKIIASQEKQLNPAPISNPTPPTPIPTKLASPPKPPDPPDDNIAVYYVFGFLVLVGLIFLLRRWLLRPHELRVGVGNARKIVSVRPGSPIFLGNEDNKKTNTIKIPGLPDTVNPEEKLARLDVKRGSVVLSSATSWEVTGSPVTIRDKKPITIKRRNPTSSLNGASIILNVENIEKKR